MSDKLETPVSSSNDISSTEAVDTLDRPGNKRKYNFQRASIACEQCRRAKTRCNYINDGSTCFRCENLSLKCSLSGQKVDPTTSSFQKAATIKVREDVEESKRDKRKKRMKALATASAISLTGYTPSSTVESFSTGRSDDMDMSSNATSNSSPGLSDPNALMLLNNKIDKLGSIINMLVEKSCLGDSINASTSANIIQNNSATALFESQLNPPTDPRTNNPFPPGSQSGLDTSFLSKLYAPPSLQSKLPSMNQPNLGSTNSFINANKAPVLQPSIAPLARPYLPPTTTMPPNQLSNFPGMMASGIHGQTQQNTNQGNLTLNTNSSGHENDAFFFLNAPYLDMINVSENMGLPFSKEIGFDIKRDLVLLSIQERYDLINRKLLDYETCFRLVETALLHYGKWISYVKTDYKAWFDTVRVNSPLLFCTLVLFGLRHHRLNTSQHLELDVLQSIHQLLSLSIYEVPQSKDFLQTTILLAHYSPSLSYKHIYFDSWWLSSYGLIHFMTREMTVNLLVKSVRSPEKVHQYRIWNHLTIAHLINCILSGRPCIIDEIRLDQCRDILDLPEANSFDAIIVAELCLTLALYNALQFPEDVDVSLKELESVYNDWKYLTTSVKLGCLITGFYHFANVLVLRRFILKNLFMKGQMEFNNRLAQFFNHAMKVSELLNYTDELMDSSDMFKQCLFLVFFILLQFKQIGLFNDPSEEVYISQAIDKMLEFGKFVENKVLCYNGYFTHYPELIVRMRNSLIPVSSHNQAQAQAQQQAQQQHAQQQAQQQLKQPEAQTEGGVQRQA